MFYNSFINCVAKFNIDVNDIKRIIVGIDDIHIIKDDNDIIKNKSIYDYITNYMIDIDEYIELDYIDINKLLSVTLILKDYSIINMFIENNQVKAVYNKY